jgi:acyl-CoA synthetase (AMP-forming)/AMP-acid ligase II
MPTNLASDAYHRWVLRADPPPVGRALFGNEVAVMNGEGRTLGAGEVGEVVIRGHSVMLGYFDAPGATAEAFRGGWFHSGDLGRWVVDDVSGRRYLVLTGRLKNIVKVDGEGVSLEEVDRLLLEHPGVDDAACFGVPDQVGGERVICLVVARAGAVAPDELRAHLARLLPSRHVPSEFVFAPHVERTATGKVLRQRLSAAYQADAPGPAR